MSTFMRAYRDLREFGQLSAPRGQKILELENYQLTLDPRERLTSFAARNLNLAYCVEEWLWYLKGDRFDTSIEEHAKIWQKIKDYDGGFNSNYGQYMFGQGQFDFAMRQLIADKDSRRAVIVLLNKSHLRDSNPDIVCTYGVSFRIRNDALNMSVSMRSNDAIFGLTNDVFCFSMLHEMMWINLQQHYPQLEMGAYCHKVDSLHVYERHFDMLNEIVDSGLAGYYHVDIPHALYPVEFELMKRRDTKYDPEEYPLHHWIMTHRGGRG